MVKAIPEKGLIITFGKLTKKDMQEKDPTLMFMNYPDKGDKYQFKPATIYIPNNKQCRSWLRENMVYGDEQFMLEVCSLISHEMLHIVLYNFIGKKACDKLDPLFGISWMDDFDDVHGLIHFDGEFKPIPKNKQIKNWMTKRKHTQRR